MKISRNRRDQTGVGITSSAAKDVGKSRGRVIQWFRRLLNPKERRIEKERENAITALIEAIEKKSSAPLNEQEMKTIEEIGNKLNNLDSQQLSKKEKEFIKQATAVTTKLLLQRGAEIQKEIESLIRDEVIYKVIAISHKPESQRNKELEIFETGLKKTYQGQEAFIKEIIENAKNALWQKQGEGQTLKAHLESKRQKKTDIGAVEKRLTEQKKKVEQARQDKDAGKNELRRVFEKITKGKDEKWGSLQE